MGPAKLKEFGLDPEKIGPKIELLKTKLKRKSMASANCQKTRRIIIHDDISDIEMESASPVIKLFELARRKYEQNEITETKIVLHELVKIIGMTSLSTSPINSVDDLDTINEIKGKSQVELEKTELLLINYIKKLGGDIDEVLKQLSIRKIKVQKKSLPTSNSLKSENSLELPTRRRPSAARPSRESDYPVGTEFSDFGSDCGQEITQQIMETNQEIVTVIPTEFEHAIQKMEIENEDSKGINSLPPAESVIAAQAVDENMSQIFEDIQNTNETRPELMVNINYSDFVILENIEDIDNEHYESSMIYRDKINASIEDFTENEIFNGAEMEMVEPENIEECLSKIGSKENIASSKSFNQSFFPETPFSLLGHQDLRDENKSYDSSTLLKYESKFDFMQEDKPLQIEKPLIEKNLIKDKFVETQEEFNLSDSQNFSKPNHESLMSLKYESDFELPQELKSQQIDETLVEEENTFELNTEYSQGLLNYESSTYLKYESDFEFSNEVLSQQVDAPLIEEENLIETLTSVEFEFPLPTDIKNTSGHESNSSSNAELEQISNAEVPLEEEEDWASESKITNSTTQSALISVDINLEKIERTSENSSSQISTKQALDKSEILSESHDNFEDQPGFAEPLHYVSNNNFQDKADTKIDSDSQELPTISRFEIQMQHNYSNEIDFSNIVNFIQPDLNLQLIGDSNDISVDFSQDTHATADIEMESPEQVARAQSIEDSSVIFGSPLESKIIKDANSVQILNGNASQSAGALESSIVEVSTQDLSFQKKSSLKNSLNDLGFKKSVTFSEKNLVNPTNTESQNFQLFYNERFEAPKQNVQNVSNSSQFGSLDYADEIEISNDINHESQQSDNEYSEKLELNYETDAADLNKSTDKINIDQLDLDLKAQQNQNVISNPAEIETSLKSNNFCSELDEKLDDGLSGKKESKLSSLEFEDFNYEDTLFSNSAVDIQYSNESLNYGDDFEESGESQPNHQHDDPESKKDELLGYLIDEKKSESDLTLAPTAQNAIKVKPSLLKSATEITILKSDPELSFADEKLKASKQSLVHHSVSILRNLDQAYTSNQSLQSKSINGSTLQINGRTISISSDGSDSLFRASVASGDKNLLMKAIVRRASFQNSSGPEISITKRKSIQFQAPANIEFEDLNDGVYQRPSKAILSRKQSARSPLALMVSREADFENDEKADQKIIDSSQNESAAENYFEPKTSQTHTSSTSSLNIPSHIKSIPGFSSMRSSTHKLKSKDDENVGFINSSSEPEYSKQIKKSEINMTALLVSLLSLDSKRENGDGIDDNIDSERIVSIDDPPTKFSFQNQVVGNSASPRESILSRTSKIENYTPMQLSKVSSDHTMTVLEQAMSDVYKDEETHPEVSSNDCNIAPVIEGSDDMKNLMQSLMRLNEYQSASIASGKNNQEWELTADDQLQLHDSYSSLKQNTSMSVKNGFDSLEIKDTGIISTELKPNENGSTTSATEIKQLQSEKNELKFKTPSLDGSNIETTNISSNTRTSNILAPILDGLEADTILDKPPRSILEQALHDVSQPTRAKSESENPGVSTFSNKNEENATNMEILMQSLMKLNDSRKSSLNSQPEECKNELNLPLTRQYAELYSENAKKILFDEMQNIDTDNSDGIVNAGSLDLQSSSPKIYSQIESELDLQYLQMSKLDLKNEKGVELSVCFFLFESKL
ncbi:hypothetical protein HK100_006538 [Physocladia obscura]|uniref:Uncharacterized protein n=1 Tax=Physocladia obscura TaxID=109957 RepID=A0AAD5T7P1_9FUNG|nr:hypothetical protein HK100_006538 [Physocladia obscura]